MKKVLSIDKITSNIQDSDVQFYQKLNGEYYRLDMVTILNTKLIDLMTWIKEQRLFYQSPY
jgi:hypothetical protein